MKDKNSNIEVLKIICMINIIIHHSFAHSILQIDLSNINFIILYVINIFGKISNNIFILITGYFMINKKIKPMHIVKIVLETWFYSYAILIISALVFKKINIDDVINSLVPILSNSEWFVTDYILLYLSIPIINKMIKIINEKEYKYIISFCVIVFSILPTIKLLEGYFSSYIWFIILYLIGGYLRINNDSCKELIEKSNILAPLLGIVIIGIMISGIKFRLMTIELNNFVFLIFSISVFGIFIKRESFSNKIINSISSSVLGIYLIHDNVILRKKIWEFFDINTHLKSETFFLYEIMVVITIFFICLVIDQIRIHLIEKPVLKKIDILIKKYSKRKENKIVLKKECQI